MSDYTPEEQAELVSRSIDEGAFKPVLYKYRKFDQFTEGIFRERRLFFSSPRMFNDPFDCQTQDTGEFTREDLIKYLEKNSVAGVDLSSIMIANARTDNQMVNQTISETIDRARNSRGILSLSQRADSVLMWSHYAESHQGFVLGFTVKEDPLYFWNPVRVAYSEAYPSFSYVREQDKIVTLGMATKAIDWKYEEEIRVIKDKPGLYPFNKKCLTHVILGAQISAENRVKILNVLNDPEYHHVIIEQAEISKSEYKVNRIVTPIIGLGR